MAQLISTILVARGGPKQHYMGGFIIYWLVVALSRLHIAQ